MPYYQWRGVDLEAHIQKGMLFAQSPDHLASLLLKKEIYLLNASLSARRFIFRRITYTDLTDFFRHLATLLEAKIHLAQALPLVAQQSDNPRFQNIVYTIADKVYSGLSFHTVLYHYPRYFSPLVVQILQIGQESGTMDASCLIVAKLMEERAALHTKIRSALLLPGITFACFIAVVLIIFIALIPRFAMTFESLKVPLPQSTRLLLTISSWITPLSVCTTIIGIALILLIFYAMMRIKQCKLFFSSMLLNIPFVGPLMHYRFCASFFQSLSTLISHTVPLNTAVGILIPSEKNSFFKQELHTFEKALAAGIPLSTVLLRSQETLFTHSVIAMTEIGQESGNLVFMLNKITDLYLRIIQKRIATFVTLIQPLLMITLGLCVALLIVLLYVPLFNLSLSVGN